MNIKSRIFVSACALALAALAPAAMAQTDYSSLCLAIGVEIGDRSDAAQVELDVAVDEAGDEVSDDDKALIDSLQELLDNLQTVSASMDVLYDYEATPPSDAEMEVVSEIGIEDLLDAASECIDAA